jgi:glycosyltransferase involved in cell wall biosynthesis
VIQLSAVIITYNEERNIARCLDSLKDLADEIVVVDSYSTDATVAICSSSGAKVFQSKFEGHIQQKNYAVEKASFAYILSLDADEVLSEELRRSIAAAKSAWNYDGYEMNRLTNYCGSWIKHGGWYPDRKLRLFDKRKGKWTGVNPHDRYTLNDAQAPVGELSGDILHYSYYSISDHLKQVDYFTEISARVLFEQRRKVSLARLIIAPGFRFFRDYVLKFGFLDGYNGFVVCKISSYAVFLKYAKLRTLWK